MSATKQYMYTFLELNSALTLLVTCHQKKTHFGSDYDVGHESSLAPRCLLHNYSIISKCYLGLIHASSIPWMFDLTSVVTGAEGQFISEATVKETSVRVISEHINMPATQLLGDKDLSLLGDDHLCVASEHRRGKLGEKEKAAFSFKYLFDYPFGEKSIEDTFYLSEQPTGLYAACKFRPEVCRI